MTTTALGVISPVVATTRLLLVVACLPNLFSSRLLLFHFLVLVIVFDLTPGTRFWGGNIEGTCLFVGFGLLHRGTPQWTRTGRQCYSLISLQPVNCLEPMPPSHHPTWTTTDLCAAWMSSRGIGCSSVKDPAVAQKPSPISSFHYHPLPIHYHSASDPSHDKSSYLSPVCKPPMSARHRCG